MKIAVYCTGKMAEGLLPHLERNAEEIKIVYFVETKKREDSFHGYAVKSALEMNPEDFSLLIIASEKYYEDILKYMMENLNFEKLKDKIVSPQKAFEWFGARTYACVDTPWEENRAGVFQEYAQYYNAFYQEKDYKTEAETIDRLIRRYGNDVRKLINFGCGTGRHDRELSKLGYRCCGIDMSANMIRIAKETTLLKESFEVADIRSFYPKETYDAVISLFHVVSYQNSNEDVLNTFRSARRALDTNGLFIFDVWYGPGVLSDRPSVRMKKAETEGCHLIKIASPVMHDKENVVEVTNDILVVEKGTNCVRPFTEVHRMRYFFRPELELLLKLAGFELIDNLDCQTLGETNYDSWTSYFVTRAT